MATMIQSGAMPTTTLLIVAGSWVLLAALTLLAYRFNRNRSGD